MVHGVNTSSSGRDIAINIIHGYESANCVTLET